MALNEPSMTTGEPIEPDRLSKRDMAGLRPTTHFLPPANWMNDPNGLIHWRGAYHLFYQHNPYAPMWATMHWGHAVSEDLVTWRHLPIALYPDTDDDRAGCFSGCCVDDNGVPTIIYTGVSNGPSGLVERVVSATSDDELLTWRKTDAPLISDPPDSLDRTGFRDPFVWREDDGTWALVIGSGTRSEGGEVLLYRSTDLRHWDYCGVLLAARDLAPEIPVAQMWEFPQIVRLEHLDVLILTGLDGRPETNNTVQHQPLLVAGHIRNDRFAVRDARRADYGDSFKAAAAFQPLASGRGLVFGWLRDGWVPEAAPAAGWAGVMSYPRQLRLAADHRLVVEPAAEVKALRVGLEAASSGSTTTGNLELALPTTGAFEIDVAGLGLARGALRMALVGRDGSPAIELDIDAGQELVTLTVHSSSVISAEAQPQQAWAPIESAARDLRIFVDASVIEVFIGGATVIAERYYFFTGNARPVQVRVEAKPEVLGDAEWTVWALDLPLETDQEEPLA